MRSKLILLLGLLVVALTATAASAASDPYALVRISLDTAVGQAFLQSHGYLDIAGVKPGVSADIVAQARDLATIRESGVPFEIVHDDLATFYASRITTKDAGAFGIFHSYSENVAFVDSLRLLHPEIVSEKWSLGQTGQGRDIWCFRVSDNPDVDESEPEVLIDGMHHAREIMASEFPIMFADYLCQNYGTDPVITWLVNNRELYIVPIMNPDGVVYNEQTDPNGGGMWRKNRRNNNDGNYGVDLNRNYPYRWAYDDNGSSPYTWDETYRGPSAASEPEVQALMGLINAHQFVTHNSFHSYSGQTLFPWGYTSTPSADDAIFQHMGQIMTQFNGYEYGAPPVILYSTNGSTTDWAYGATTHPKIYTFSNEIGRTGFWPAESERGSLFQENIWPTIYLMMAAGPFVQVSDAVATDTGGGTLDPGEAGALDLSVTNQSVAADLNDLLLTFACDDPYVQLGAATRTIASLPAMGTVGLGADPVPFTVSANCPSGHLVQLTVTASWTGGSIDYPIGFLVGSPSVIFSDDFSGDTGNWTLAGGPWGLTSTAHSAPSALTDSPSGNYADQISATATLNGTFYASTLTFWQRYYVESGYDYCRVQVSANGGAWNTLANYTGSNTSWHQVSFDLSAFAGQPLRFRFLLESDYSLHYDGWYIDDVELLGAGGNNVTPAPPALLAPADGASVSGPVTLTVANSIDPDGSDALTYGFRVYSDADLTQVAATTDGVTEGDGGQTSWDAGNLGTGTYWWRAYAADASEWGLLGDVRSFSISTSTGVDGVVIGGPRLSVLGNGEGSARLQLSLTQAGAAQVKIYNARGMLVRDLFSGDLGAGAHILVWDGRDRQGGAAASGVYFVRATASERTLVNRVVIVR